MIVVDQVTKRFGTQLALGGVSLEIPAGGIFGIIGPNGAGKTTLFRLICKLAEPDSGSISVNGFRDELGVKRQLAYLPEEHRLYEHLTALDYLRYFGDLHALPDRRSVEVLAGVGLAHKAKEKVSALSKGMRQKLGFARVLLADPPVLVLDEPTYGLDPGTAAEMRGWISRLAETKVVVLSSHNLHEAERVCAKVAVLHRGKLAACGTPAELVQGLGREHVIDIGFKGDGAPLARALAALGPSQPPVLEPTQVRLYFPAERAPLPTLRAVVEALGSVPGAEVTRIVPREPTLEDVFLHVTGEAFPAAEDPRAEGAA